MEKVIEIITGQMDPKQKKSICITLFGLTEDEANSLINVTT